MYVLIQNHCGTHYTLYYLVLMVCKGVIYTTSTWVFLILLQRKKRGKFLCPLVVTLLVEIIVFLIKIKIQNNITYILYFSHMLGIFLLNKLYISHGKIILKSTKMSARVVAVVLFFFLLVGWLYNFL